jgi:uncharacterized protein
MLLNRPFSLPFVPAVHRVMKVVIAGFWLTAFSACLAFAGNPMVIAIDPAPLVITTQGTQVAFDVEVADNDLERAAGLMFRVDLPANRAMLFDFGTTRPVSMWMKNTPLPLDMLFLDEAGLVVKVAPSTVPQSLDVISSQQPVRYVVEINAGQAAQNNIKTGDKVAHPLIKP